MSYRIRNIKTQEIICWRKNDQRIFILLGDAKVHMRNYNFPEDKYEIVESKDGRNGSRGGRKRKTPQIEL